MKRYTCVSPSCDRTARRYKDSLPAPSCQCGAGPMLESPNLEPKRPAGRRAWPKPSTNVRGNTKGDVLRAVEFWLDQGAGVVGAWHPDDMEAGEHDAEVIKSLVIDQLRKVPTHKMVKTASLLKRGY